VIEKKDRAYLDPVRIYGARSADGTLIHSEAKPGSPETIPTFKLMPIATLIEKLRDNPVAYSVVEYNGSNHFQPWILKPALRKAANATAAAATLAAAPVEVAPAQSAVGGVQGGASLAGGAQESVAYEEEAVEDDDGEWVALDGGPFTAHLVKGGPRSTAPIRNYKVTIPFRDATPIYSGGKIKLPIVPGAPSDGIVLQMPLLPPTGAKELTFTLKLDRAGATADSVTINSALYWKVATAAAQATVEAEADEEVEAAQEQLAIGDRFVVIDDPLNPFAIATVVAVNTDATRFMSSAKGEEYHVRITQFKTDSELREAAQGLSQRNLDDCHLVGVDMAPRPPPRSSSRPRKRARLSHPSSQEEGTSDIEAPLPTIVDDVDHSDLSVGQHVVAYGRSPNGEWTKFNAVINAFRERAPHVVVKYISDMQGNKIRIGLPSPITAYLSRTDIEVVEG